MDCFLMECYIKSEMYLILYKYILGYMDEASEGKKVKCLE